MLHTYEFWFVVGSQFCTALKSSRPSPPGRGGDGR